jgi:hypothetical protein
MTASRAAARAVVSFSWVASIEKLALSAGVFVVLSTTAGSLCFSGEVDAVVLFDMMAERAFCSGLIIGVSLAMKGQGRMFQTVD